MYLPTSIWLVILGVLGAANLIIARRPDAKEYIAKLAPYQGWIGAVSAIIGLLGVVFSILGIAGLGLYPILWSVNLATNVVMMLLGFLLGVGVLKTFIKDPAANQRMDETIAKLSPYQGTLGLVAIGVGIALLVLSFLPTM